MCNIDCRLTLRLALNFVVMVASDSCEICGTIRQRKLSMVLCIINTIEGRVTISDYNFVFLSTAG